MRLSHRHLQKADETLDLVCYGAVGTCAQFLYMIFRPANSSTIKALLTQTEDGTTPRTPTFHPPSTRPPARALQSWRASPPARL